MKWICRNEKDKNIVFNNGNFLLIPILALIYAHYEFYFWSRRPVKGMFIRFFAKPEIVVFTLKRS